MKRYREPREPRFAYFALLSQVFNAESGECSLELLDGHSYDVNTVCLLGNTLFSGSEAK